MNHLFKTIVLNNAKKSLSPVSSVLLHKRSMSKQVEVSHKKILVQDCNLHYAETNGNPDHVLCIIPGSLSSIDLDFLPLVKNLNPEKFKVIAFDPPGLGRSRPPNRWEVEGIWAQRDAIYAKTLLEKLGYSKYSLLGWSMGAFSASWMSAENPERVRKLVAWGMSGYWDEHTGNLCKLMAAAGIKSIPEPRLTQLLAEYGKEDLTKMFDEWLNKEDGEAEAIGFTKDGPFTNEILKKITCPTLLIHGMKDRFVLPEQAKYVHSHITGSKLHLFENGNHGTHTEKEFISVVERFLSDSPSHL